MIISITSKGVTQGLAEAMLDALADYNAAVYTEDSALLRIERVGVLYRPDAVGTIISLHAVDTLLSGAIVSCGTASAAWLGWHRARGVTGTIELRRTAPRVWHATANVGGVVWDPAVRLRWARSYGGAA